ncbi:hypothetical protein BCV70DRAFT_54176 [Testicularia cyperi]|uniref:Zn(2)-C6 fungal-type domain-containing protein n=1 Tax=Testicularia cyperi TaxID=1882483 RepID=A0A317XXA6_9BASI|nr:hypothetical protein BCV70DRAFT_54176 [Testicularia cyperi]
MEPGKSNRKVVPNYLLDDLVPPSETKAGGRTISSSTLISSSASTSSIAAHTGNNAGDSSDSSTKELLPLPRRKKKLRQACVYCRRSHLVCEEKRPCTRCVKRGIADRCVDPPNDAANGLDSIGDNSLRHSPPMDRPDGSQSYLPAQQGKRKRSSVTSHGSETQETLASASVASRNVAAAPSSSYPPSQGHVPYATSAPYESSTLAAVSGPQPGASHHESLGHDMSSSAIPTYQVHSTAAGGGPVTPSASRMSSSQLLQAQPIFRPPSSAELDSLFSSYFFDVADAFSGAQLLGHHPVSMQNAVNDPTARSTHPSAVHDDSQIPAMHHNDHQRQRQQHPQHVPPQQGSQHHQHSHAQIQPHLQPHAAQQHQQPLQHQHQHQHQSHSHMHMPQQSVHRQAQQGPEHYAADASLASAMISKHDRPQHIPGMHPSRPTAISSSISAPTLVREGVLGEPRAASVPVKSEPAQHQQPGDVYAPYPYRKGYASLMRYMTEQNWSEQSIRSVEAALSKVRKLWFSLEDNIQPSSMIQLQAEWAGNVRYFSESVLPFTPVPMVVCRKAGEVYASNTLAQDLCRRTREQMSGGKISCYQLMTEESASQFFRLYEIAVGDALAEDGSHIPNVGNTTPLYWNADIVIENDSGTRSIVPTRGIFEMKIAPCGLPSLLVCCFVPLQ